MRELRETAGERVVGFVDDNPRLRRRSVHGVKVLGTTHEFARCSSGRSPTSCSSRSRTRPRELARRRRRGVRRGRRRLPLRSSRDRSRPARRVRRRVRMTEPVTTVPSRPRDAGARADAARPPARRAFPLVALALGVLLFYAVEAWPRKTPWVFTDELEWTQLSRSIAATGPRRAARRADLLQVALRLRDRARSGGSTRPQPPTRDQVRERRRDDARGRSRPTCWPACSSRRRAAMFVAAASSVTVPAMAYATSIVPEVLAYPYYALCSWLDRPRARVRRRRRDLVVAGVVLGCSATRPRSRSSRPSRRRSRSPAAGLWLTWPRGAGAPRNWTRGDTSAPSCCSSAPCFSSTASSSSTCTEWQVSTQYCKNRMVDLGLRAGLSFTIGMGILPVIGGLARCGCRERRGDPVYRAFAA